MSGAPWYSTSKRGGPKTPKLRNPTTSFLTATTLIYAIGAGITAAAGTRLALQWFIEWLFTKNSFQFQDRKGPRLGFIVTTSLCQDWVIYAPAALLGCGSRLSGSLSGIKPWFSVTRYRHGRPIPYHRKLIGQKLEWFIAGLTPLRSAKLLWFTKDSGTSPGWFLSNKYTPSVRSGLSASISSRITTVILVVRYYQINYNWYNEPFAVSLFKGI